MRSPIFGVRSLTGNLLPISQADRMWDNFNKFGDVKVLVLGDVMLDQYWWGVVDRISPEAPVPIVALNKKSIVAGGAANVAANVAGLGATPFLFGVAGNDADGALLIGLLKAIGVSTDFLMTTDLRPTTVKTRIIANNQQVIRLDRENSNDISDQFQQDILANVTKMLDQVDVVLVSDYAKGVITERLVSGVIDAAKNAGKPILIDPKGKDYAKYRGASILTPNQKEALDAAGLENNDEETVRIAGERLIANYDLENLVITRGEKGMSLFGKGSETKNIETVARRVYDVTGAGDTVISTMAVSLGTGSDFETACSLANMAAGVVVERLGTAPVNVKDLEEYLSK